MPSVAGWCAATSPTPSQPRRSPPPARRPLRSAPASPARWAPLGAVVLVVGLALGVFTAVAGGWGSTGQRHGRRRRLRTVLERVPAGHRPCRLEPRAPHRRALTLTSSAGLGPGHPTGRPGYHRPMESIVLTSAQTAFLAGRHFATVATIDEDGAPRQAVVWYRLEPDGPDPDQQPPPAPVVQQPAPDRRVAIAIPDVDDRLPVARPDGRRGRGGRGRRARPGRHRGARPPVQRRRHGGSRRTRRRSAASRGSRSWSG